MKKAKQVFTLFAMVFFVLSGKTVYAANVGQSAETTTSITINWVMKDNATAYYIGYGKNDKAATNMLNDKTIKLSADQSSYTITNLKPGNKYTVKVGYTYTENNNERNDSVGSFSAYTKPGKVANVNQDKWWYYIKNVRLKWDSQPAVKYDCVIKDNKRKTIYNKTNLSYNNVITGVKNNVVYEAKVRATVKVQRLNGKTKKLTGEWSDVTYLFTQPMIKKNSKVTGGKLKVSWDKVKGCTEYDVYVSTKEKRGYEKVASVKSSKNSVTVDNLKGKKFSAKKKYYVYIVGKKKAGEKTSTSGRHYTYQIKGNKGQLMWTFDK